ncbi:MAG: VacB/RNase II family 3'-5' exoribonuclease, partial [Rhodoferax sp.]|nr:VacB/RNase II family 3'-5' exoribonuclease [Rhodoferax sp.]
AKAGQVVVVELTEPPALYGQPVGRVREVLGNIDDPGMEIEIAVRKFSVPHEFSEACIAATRTLPDSVLQSDKTGRVNLTDVPLVTIDGEDARDFDDAVYCAPHRVGRGRSTLGWRLLVAIADVDHYVSSGDPIDSDAFDRATSVYFPRRVIPMLPEKLSNGLCSLNPGVERLCMVCDMVISAEGSILAFQFFPAVMLSHARFTYEEVSAILANSRGPEAQKHSDRVDDLLHLHGVFEALVRARTRRGALDLETAETQIVCDQAGRIDKIVPRQRTIAHRLIEEAMLAANVCSAQFVEANHRLALYRVHDGPTPEKRESLRTFLKALGLSINGPDPLTTADYQAVVVAARDRPDAQQIHMTLLRSMQQALYSPLNTGHFGLAVSTYTHFTSPIRRYPDLLVHRVIKAILNGTSYSLPNLPVPGEAHAKLVRRLAKGRSTALPGVMDQDLPEGTELFLWGAAGLHCSANERRADEASRDVEAWLKCLFMRDRLGEEYSGVVTAVTHFGLFVTLDALYVEGLIHITELGDDFYRLDDVRQELRGERTGMRFGVGTKVRVQVSRVDLDGRRIDFRMIADGEVPTGGPVSGKEKSAGRERNSRSLGPDLQTKPGITRVSFEDQPTTQSPKAGKRAKVAMRPKGERSKKR